MQELVGIIVGHTYFFLMYKYPQEMGGPQLIQTPQILLVFYLLYYYHFLKKLTSECFYKSFKFVFCRYKFFPNERTVHGFGQAPTRATPAAAAAPNQPQGGNDGINYRRHNWGRGYVLGQQQ